MRALSSKLCPVVLFLKYMITSLALSTHSLTCDNMMLDAWTAFKVCRLCALYKHTEHESITKLMRCGAHI